MPARVRLRWNMGDIEVAQWNRQALASSFYEGLFARPELKEQLVPAACRSRPEHGYFSLREEIAGDLLDIDIRIETLHVDADLHATAECEQGESAGMGNVERQAVLRL